MAVKPVNVAVVVLPAMVAPPGLAVTVQLLAGRLLSATLAVASAQLGWVMVPITGAAGVTGWLFITALADATDVQPLD